MGFEFLPVPTQVAIAFILVLLLWFHVRYNEASISHGPTILTTTGIFATFVGIAVGLSQFQATHIEESVPALLDGLKTAFWGSICGVGGALTLKFRQLLFGNPRSSAGTDVDGSVTAEDLARLLKNIQQALVGSDDSTLITQIKLARQENNDRLDALKKAQIEALEKLSEIGSKQLVEALKDVIRDFNAKLTEQFGDNFQQLNEAVAKLVTWQQQYKDHVETITAELNQITSAMKAASSNYETLVSKADAFSKISADLSELLTALETQRKSLELQRSALDVSMTKLGELITKASDGLPKIEAKVVEMTAQTTKAVADNAVQLRTSIESSGNEIARLNEAVSRQFSDMISKTKEQVAALDAALNAELKLSLESLGKQLSALSNKFVSDYTPLTDKLRALVQVGRVQ